MSFGVFLDAVINIDAFGSIKGKILTKELLGSSRKLRIERDTEKERGIESTFGANSNMCTDTRGDVLSNPCQQAQEENEQLVAQTRHSTTT